MKKIVAALLAAVTLLLLCTACSTPDPMATMEKSIRYIQKEL